MIDIERPSGFTSERTLASDFEKLLLIPNAFSFLHIPLVLCENVSAANFRELFWNGVWTFSSVAYFMIYTHRHTNVHTRKNTDMNTQTHTWAGWCQSLSSLVEELACLGSYWPFRKLFDETGWRFG